MSTAIAVRPSSHESPLPSRETPASERHSHPARSGSSPRSYAPTSAWTGSGSGSGRDPHQHPQPPMQSSSPSPSRPPPQSTSVTTPSSQRHAEDGRQHETNPQRTNSYGPNANTPTSSAEKQSKPSYAPIIKKERAASPDASSQHSGRGGTPGSGGGRHRPRRLDLSNSTPVAPGAKSAKQTAPLTAKESGALSAMQDVGLACLSPGFTTDNPDTQRLLEKSMDVREQQRRIIESRLNRSGKDGEGSSKGPLAGGPPSATFSRPLANTRRKGPPPGLSITAPSAHQFASEPRVIQSAPLHQSFTGLNKPGSSSNAHPLSRQVLEHSHQQYAHAQSPVAATGPGAASSSHYPPQPPQTALPSISNMFPHEGSGGSPAQRPIEGPGSSSRRNSGGSLQAPSSSQHPALPSPGFPPGHPNSLHPPQRHQEREFRSAEEAVHSMAGGREDLLPKIVHYGGHQPPTPPSPLPPGRSSAAQSHQGLSQVPQNPAAPPPPHQPPQYAPYQNNSYSSSSSSYRHDHTNNTNTNTTNNNNNGNLPRSSSSRRRTREEYEQDSDRMDIDARTADERERRRGPVLDWTAERERDIREKEGKYAEYGRIGAPPSSSSAAAAATTTTNSQSQQLAPPLQPLSAALAAAVPGAPVARSELKESLQHDREFRDHHHHHPHQHPHHPHHHQETIPAAAPGASVSAASEVQRRKKAEFMDLCARAWDLLHS